MQPYFTIIPIEKKCPLCGGEFFCEEVNCSSSCYFRCEQRNIVIDFADEVNDYEDLFRCCTLGKGNSITLLNNTKSLMELGYKIF